LSSQVESMLDRADELLRELKDEYDGCLQAHSVTERAKNLTHEVLEKLRNALMKPFVIAGTTRDIGDLVDYLINNGVRYEEEPYGIRPAKFAVVNDKIMS